MIILKSFLLYSFMLHVFERKQTLKLVTGYLFFNSGRSIFKNLHKCAIQTKKFHIQFHCIWKFKSKSFGSALGFKRHVKQKRTATETERKKMCNRMTI